MNSEQDYTAASLSQSLVDDLKTFEDKMRNETNKDVIIIAYEKETNN